MASAQALSFTVAAFMALVAASGNPTAPCGLVGVLTFFAFNEFHLRRNYFVELRSRALIVRRGSSGASVRYRDINYVEPTNDGVVVGNHSRQGYCAPRELLRVDDASGFLLELAIRRREAGLA